MLQEDEEELRERVQLRQRYEPPKLWRYGTMTDMTQNTNNPGNPDGGGPTFS